MANVCKDVVMVKMMVETNWPDNTKPLNYLAPFYPKTVDLGAAVQSLVVGRSWTRVYLVPAVDVEAVDKGTVDVIRRILAAGPLLSGATTLVQAGVVAGSSVMIC